MQVLSIVLCRCRLIRYLFHIHYNMLPAHIELVFDLTQLITYTPTVDNRSILEYY